MFAEHQESALQALQVRAPAPRVTPAPRVAPEPRHNFTTRLEIVVDLIDAPLEAPSCCIPYVLGVPHRRDQERLCRLCANTLATKSFKYQSAVLGAKISSGHVLSTSIQHSCASKALP